MATKHSCEQCGRPFKGAKGLAWHAAHPDTCVGFAKLPRKRINRDWHPSVTCEQAHPGVKHVRATIRLDNATDTSHESRESVAALFPSVAPAPAKPVRTSKAKQRKLDKAAAVANAKAGAHAVQPHASAARKVRVHTGAVDPATLPLCGRNGRPLHGAALANAQRTLAAERIMPAPVSLGEQVAALMAQVEELLAAMPVAS